MKELVKVHAVPTEKASNLAKIGGLWIKYHGSAIPETKSKGSSNYHLYFTSSEPIEDDFTGVVLERLTTGEWTLWQIDNPNDIDRANQRKIVATLNSDLWERKWEFGDPPSIARKGFAKIGEDFTKAFVDTQGKITEVMLDFDVNYGFGGSKNSVVMSDKDGMVMWSSARICATDCSD